MKLIRYFYIILFVAGLCIVPDAYCQVPVKTTARHEGAKSDIARQTVRATGAYTTAISEYIKAVYKIGVPRPDTLFIGKNADMPDIILPTSIQGINTVLTTSEDAGKKLSYRSSLVYLNVVGWLDKNRAEFIIVKFHEFKPQHNCTIHFRYDSKGEMQLTSLSFQYPYGKKQGMQKKKSLLLHEHK